MTKKERNAMGVQVTTITITRARKVQPEQYGSADASITLVANVDEGADWQKEARALLADTRAIVYENLGLKLPARAIEEAKAVDTPTETAKVEAKTEDKPAAGKKRGRPAKKDKETAPAALAPDDDIPTDEPQIRKNPEDRKDPADVSDDIPDDGLTEAEAAATGPTDDDIPDDGEDTEGGTADEDPIGDYTVGDLQGYLTNLVKDKKVSAQKVREIIASHGVGRTSDLPADKVLVVKQQIDAAVSGD